METKTCIACSMPMKKVQDYANGDVNKDYCYQCAREDGSMKSYEEVLEDSISWALENFQMIGFTKKPTEAEARKVLAAHMATMPAWKNRK